MSQVSSTVISWLKDAWVTCLAGTREATNTISQRKFCLGCSHPDAMKCMQETLRPGSYGDQDWIDVGAPDKCDCPCHEENTDGQK